MKVLFKAWIELTALLGLLAVVGAIIGAYLLEYHAGSEFYIQLAQLVQETAAADISENTSPAAFENDSFPYNIDFEALKKINSDIVAWIVVPDTRINSPIAKRENDNNFYLTHLFDKSENKTGCIFLDTRCSLGDTHAIIHGHNMGNGTMFRDLNLFKDGKFFQEHPYYYILTSKKNIK